MVKTPSQSRQASEHDPENLPEVDGLESTPDTTDNSSSSSAPAAPQADRDRLKWQMQSQADTIKALQEQLQHATDVLQESQHTQAELNSLVQQLTPGRCETPGPHRLQPKGLRQEDKDFQDKVRKQPSDETPPLNPTDPGLLFIKTLAKVVSENHHHDLNEPIKFTGQDQHWDEFYYQLRSYLAAKERLATFDHLHGPGHHGFDNDVNLKIYNKLTSLCHKGTAIWLG
jgi:hypothetical protein